MGNHQVSERTSKRPRIKPEATEAMSEPSIHIPQPPRVADRATRPQSPAMKRLLDDLAVPETYRSPDPTELPTNQSIAIGRRKPGAPTTFTQELAERLCARIAKGENVLAICAEPGMPAWETLRGWRARHPQFAQDYAGAREASAEMFENKALDAADEATAENAHAARLKVDTFKWAASKRLPKVYGDRIEQHVTGEVVHMTEDQRRARIQALEARRLGREAAVGVVIEGVGVPPDAEPGSHTT